MVKGLGRLVLQQIENHVQILYPGEILYIEANNTALGFYEKMGYQKMCTLKASDTANSLDGSYDCTFIYKIF